MTQYRIGIDVGGTFTDIVALADDRLVRRKVRSTPADFSGAVLEGLELVLKDAGATGDEVQEVIHGTTVASNAIIERKGARTGLLTTRGFRDVLEIGRLRTPRLYDLTWRKPVPLVERELRMEATERVTTDGAVYQPLDEEEARQALERLIAKGVESIAVCYINSFANPEHERRTGEILRSMAPGISFSLSHQVLPELREYERTSTTVINAYIRPLVDQYLAGLEKGLLAQGVEAPLLIMQSSGGITSSSLAREKPVHIVESGPAAGVMGALHLGKRTGYRSVISFDMGGTTAKAATIEEGQVALHSEYEVGGEMSMGHHLLKGGGYALRVPSVELAEVGSGGGSIARLDAGGVLQVGPSSAGAYPGPACYDTGGTEPTVTDANVVLGYLNPDHLVGGDLPINAEASHRVIRESIAVPMGMDMVQAAFGIYLVANSRMIRAINAVTREKGRNPLDFTLCAFGGSGPAHAVAMARDLGIRRVLVLPLPASSAPWGCCLPTSSTTTYRHSGGRRRVWTCPRPTPYGKPWIRRPAPPCSGRCILRDEGSSGAWWTCDMRTRTSSSASHCPESASPTQPSRPWWRDSTKSISGLSATGPTSRCSWSICGWSPAASRRRRGCRIAWSPASSRLRPPPGGRTSARTRDGWRRPS